MRYRSLPVVLCAGLAACGPQAGPGDSPEVLATVAGRAITTLDLEEYEANLPDYLRSKKEGTAAHGAHLQSLVDRELVLGEAGRRGLDRLPELERTLSAMVEERAAGELSRELIEAAVTITEEELRAFYEEQSLGWQIWPAHILSATEEEAREIIRLVSEGADFPALARERSLAGDADRGGDLQAFFGPSDAVPTLRQGVFHLEEGQVSEPIRTFEGWEVVTVLRKRRLPFEKLRQQISQRLVHRKGWERRVDVIDSLKEARGLRYHRRLGRAVLDGLHGREIDPARAQAVLIEYEGGAITVRDAVEGLRSLQGDSVPPDTAAVFRALDERILPDTLLVLEARARELPARPDMLEWKESRRPGLMAARLRQDVVEGRVEVTAEEVRDHYDRNLESYSTLPGFIHMTEVLCETRAQADSILARARAGERLEALAARHSVRPGMRPVGGHTFGDSGRVTIKPLYQSPYRTAFGDRNTEDVGALQGPLEVQQRYSVFRLDQAFEKEAVPFWRLRRRIGAQIRRGREAALFEAFLDSLRRAHAPEVEIREEALSRYAGARQDRDSR